MNVELDTLLDVLSASFDALSTTLPANTEAVLHNLTTPTSSVVRIINGHVSGREVGAPLLSGPDDDNGFLGLLDDSARARHRVFSGYTSRTASGTVLNSSSTIYYSPTGEPLAAFCINVDVGAVNRFRRELDYFTRAVGPAPAQDTSKGYLPTASIDDVLLKYRPTGSESKMEFRMRVVSEIHAMGFFKIKGSVNHVARALGVTRFTIYNYLEKIDGKQIS